MFLNDKLKQSEKIAHWINLTVYQSKLKKEEGQFKVASGFDNHPVVGITWYGANAYCKWLSIKTGEHYRLPTEAEWEYAAKAVTKEHAFSENSYLESAAWYRDTSDGKVHEVGTTEANRFGIYDMRGNVYEWCFDWYNENYYAKSKKNNPVEYSSALLKCIRGGGWDSFSRLCRINNRDGLPPEENSDMTGFRIVREK